MLNVSVFKYVYSKRIADTTEADVSALPKLKLKEGNKMFERPFVIKSRKQQRSESSHVHTLEHKNISNERGRFIRRLLSGVAQFNPRIAAELGVSLDNEYFTVVIFRINRTDETDTSDLSTINYAAYNIGCELFEANASNVSCYGIEQDNGDVAFLINHGEVYSPFKSFIDLKRHIYELFGVGSSISYCSMKSDASEINKVYQNAKYAMLYRLTRSAEENIDYKYAEKRAQKICEYPKYLERELLEELNSSNADAAKKTVDNFVNTIINASYDNIMLNTARLLMAISAGSPAAADDVQVGDASHSIFDELSSVESVEALKDFIFDKCRVFIKTINRNSSDSKKELVAAKMLSFIDENYTSPTLSVEMVAAHVNKSANYTRSIFKNVKGISLSDYIAEKRFNRVCKLLIETDMTARDISKQVGLNSGSYFYTAFKRRTGFTPDQYRKVHRAKAN